MFEDYLPKKQHITKHKHLAWLGRRIHDQNLWKFNISSVPRGLAVGLFVAFIPLPLQMLLAVLLGLLLRANLPTAVACTWITNPITFIPINYFIYNLGEKVLNIEHHEINIKPLVYNAGWIENYEILKMWFQTLGKRFFVGLPIVAFSTAIGGYILLTAIWWIVIKFKVIAAKKGVGKHG